MEHESADGVARARRAEIAVLDGIIARASVPPRNPAWQSFEAFRAAVPDNF